MTGRISIPALREHPNGEPANNDGNGEWRWSDETILALVDAVEAAQKCLVVTEGEDGERWVSLSPGGQLALHQALARFDFGDDA